MISPLGTALLDPADREAATARRRSNAETAMFLLRCGMGFLVAAAVFFVIVGASSAASPRQTSMENCSHVIGARCDGATKCCSDALACIVYTADFAKCEPLVVTG